MTISGNLSPFQLHPVHRMLLESANTEFSKRLVSAFLDSSTAVSRADSASHWRKGVNRKVSLLWLHSCPAHSPALLLQVHFRDGICYCLLFSTLLSTSSQQWSLRMQPGERGDFMSWMNAHLVALPMPRKEDKAWTVMQEFFRTFSNLQHFAAQGLPKPNGIHVRAVILSTFPSRNLSSLCLILLTTYPQCPEARYFIATPSIKNYLFWFLLDMPVSDYSGIR